MKFKDAVISALAAYIVATSKFWVLGGWCRRLIIGLMATVIFLVVLDWIERAWKRMKKWIKRKRAQRAAALSGRKRNFITVRL